MTASETVRNTLDGLNQTLHQWTKLQFGETTNIALGLREHIVVTDMPQLRRVRWYAMHDQVHAAELWQRYVENTELEGELKETVFDFYVTGASFIWLNNPTPQADYEAFVKHLATNLSWMKRCELVPDDIRGHSAEQEQIEEFLKGNHWAIFLILLSMQDVQ